MLEIESSVVETSESLPKDTLPVLNNGYVRLVEAFGSDLSVVNAARASFQKESEEFSVSDARLVAFLGKNGHTSPFRHAFATFEFKAPLMVARQHWKYVVGSDHTMDGWNEGSRRYVTADTEFYVPAQDGWRSAADDKKQGSGGPIGPWDGTQLTQELMEYIDKGEALYRWAMENMGVCPEQARLFLPAYGMHVYYRWSASLQSIGHFLAQRLREDAQDEIVQYARAVYKLIMPKFPVSVPALVGDTNA
jgi:thymidylate synthase (FAD)